MAATPIPKPGRPTVSGAPVTSASGSRPKRVTSPRDRTPPLPAALVGQLSRFEQRQCFIAHLCGRAWSFSQIGIRWSRQQLGRPPREVEGRVSVAARRAGTAIDCRFAMGYIVRARSLAVDAEVEVRGSVSLVRIFDVTLLDGSLLPAPIMGWPDLEAFRGRWGLGGCREVIRMGGRRGIRRRRGLGGGREVIPGTE